MHVKRQNGHAQVTTVDLRTSSALATSNNKTRDPMAIKHVYDQFQDVLNVSAASNQTCLFGNDCCVSFWTRLNSFWNRFTDLHSCRHLHAKDLILFDYNKSKEVKRWKGHAKQITKVRLYWVHCWPRCGTHDRRLCTYPQGFVSAQTASLSECIKRQYSQIVDNGHRQTSGRV